MPPFVEPATPVLRTVPPRGAEWLHEVKFDGWRIQLHKQGRLAEIYTKSGYRCTLELELIAAALTHLPVKSCIITNKGSRRPRSHW